MRGPEGKYEYADVLERGVEKPLEFSLVQGGGKGGQEKKEEIAGSQKSYNKMGVPGAGGKNKRGSVEFLEENGREGFGLGVVCVGSAGASYTIEVNVH